MKPKIQKSGSLFTLHCSLLLCSLLTVHCSLNAQQYGWTDISGNLPSFPGDTMIINNPPDTVFAGFHALCFINDNEGWIASATYPIDSCVILHTIDGGDSWEVQSIMDYIIAIEMFDESEGYAAAREGTIYHTNDGGETWQFHAPTFAWLSDMDFPPNSDTGYVCGMNSAMFRITPEGTELMTTGTVSDLDAIHFVDRDHGWACGESVLLQYKNGAWIGDMAYPSGFWLDVFFTDTLNGWGAGYWLTGGGTPVDTAVIIHTTNDSSWFTAQLINVGYTGNFEKVFFLDNQMGWTINSSGWIYSTTDGGNTWAREAEGMTEDYLVRIQFTSPHNGYIVGNNKTLLKYTQLTGMEEETGRPGDKERGAVEVWPNPTRGVVSLKSLVVNRRSASVELLNIYGNLLEIKATGTGESDGASGTLEFDLGNYPAGIYLIRIVVDDHAIVKKIIKH